MTQRCRPGSHLGERQLRQGDQLRGSKEGPDLACWGNGQGAMPEAEAMGSVREAGLEQWAAGLVVGWKPLGSPQQRRDTV